MNEIHHLPYARACMTVESQPLRDRQFVRVTSRELVEVLVTQKPLKRGYDFFLWGYKKLTDRDI